jgi:hypothetical protein
MKNQANTGAMMTRARVITIAGFIFSAPVNRKIASALHKTQSKYGPTPEAPCRQGFNYFHAMRNRAFPLRSSITVPFRFLFFTVTMAVKIIGFIIGFGFRALRFAAGRSFALLFAAAIGLFLGRKLFSEKRN